ncbi:MAG: cation:proton antiporter [Bacteroidales bacterium]|nr:cation:proton antiporter [Bacteroidales bacterium]
MGGEFNLVTSLALIFIAAGVFTVIFRALKQPLILGYILAGFIVGPHLGLFPQFSPESVHEWSDLGIVFLLFGLGLEFSFKKLLKTGVSAVITALVNLAGMFVLGIIVGRALGWTSMESIFLGGMLSMSSTTVIIKAFNDMGLKNKPYSGLVFGTLVIEDLIAVLLMVLLSTLAASNKFEGGQMLLALAKLVVFLIMCFVVGIYVIPTVFRKARRFLSPEILTIVSIGLCFLMVTLATYAGFSSALGAFIMGSLLAETIEGENIGNLVSPIKDLFGAVFFVSVGMMVDPSVIGAHWLPVLVLVFVAMGGILIFSSTGALLSGKGLNIAVHTGFSLAQIGEFSFIIAGLGTSLGVMREFIYPVMITVSVITAFLTPYMIRLADPAYAFLLRRLPPSTIEKLSVSTSADRQSSKAERNEWGSFIRTYLTRVGIYGILLAVIFALSSRYLDALMLKLLPGAGEFVRNLISVVITIAIMLPFLWGVTVNGKSLRDSSKRLLKSKPGNILPIAALVFIRVFISAGFVLAVIVSHFNLPWWAILLLVIVLLFFFVLARDSMSRFTGLEEKFFANLNQKEEMERRRAPVSSKIREKLGDYDIRLEAVVISSDFEYIGKALRDIPFQGVNIVKIQRGSRTILTPGAGEVLYPADRVLAVGTREQLDSFLELVASSSKPSSSEKSGEFELSRLLLDDSSALTGRTLREANLRSNGCTLISVMRGGVVMTNPSPDLRFAPGDIVWIAGEKSA